MTLEFTPTEQYAISLNRGMVHRKLRPALKDRFVYGIEIWGGIWLSLIFPKNVCISERIG